MQCAAVLHRHSAMAAPNASYHNVHILYQDVELLEKLWGTVDEWQQMYQQWKDGKFGDLKIEQMEEAAGKVAKSLQRLGREVKHWPAWSWIKVCRALQAPQCTLYLPCLLKH